jgi:cytochrome c556
MRVAPAFLAAAVLASCATPLTPPVVAVEAGLAPDSIVAARKAAFMLSAATFGGMKPVVERGGDVKTLAFGARGLARWAEALPAMFPESTRGLASRAKAEVWTDRPGFEARAATFRAATAALLDRASAGDAAGFAAQYAAVNAACDGCHETYRAPPPPR